MKLSEEIKEIIKENDCQINHLESEYNLYKNGDEKRYADDCKKDLYYYQNKKRIYENMLPKIEQLEKISKEMYDYLKYISDKEALNYECLNEIDIIIKKWEEINNEINNERNNS